MRHQTIEGACGEIGRGQRIVAPLTSTGCDGAVSTSGRRAAAQWDAIVRHRFRSALRPPLDPRFAIEGGATIPLLIISIADDAALTRVKAEEAKAIVSFSHRDIEGGIRHVV
jgi:hypothetical protein